MKKYFVSLIILLIFPIIVKAESCSGISETYCEKSNSSCLSGLQNNGYNKWSTSGNTGETCIKVIAERNGTTTTYLSGMNPKSNYKCSDGSVATATRIASALPSEETSATGNYYVPELWKVVCPTSSSGNNSGSNTGNNGSNSGNTNNSGTTTTPTTTRSSSSGSSNNGTTNNGNGTSTNSNGQITGTTESKDTGVKTYFIVLFLMAGVAYLVLVVFKKKNLFKNI